MAPENIPLASVALDTSQPLRSWLNAGFVANIPPMLVTLVVFQELISPLKLLVAKSEFIFVTLVVFQLFRLALTLPAPSNIASILVTAERSGESLAETCKKAQPL